MLRTNNKRLHANLWTWAHFLGSALCVLIPLFVSFYVQWKTATDSVSYINLTQLVYSFDFLESYIGSGSSIMYFWPISNLINVICPLGYDEMGSFGVLLYTLAGGLDLALWFNVMLWGVQFMLFLPDWLFHWLESKKGD